MSKYQKALYKMYYKKIKKEDNTEDLKNFLYEYIVPIIIMIGGASCFSVLMVEMFL